MSQIVGDIRATYEPEWRRRGLWNRSYYEARVPAAPTMLLELLSHQNFADMRYGSDPRFKFLVSRAVYKAILRFISYQYGRTCVVQPLPVEGFSATFTDCEDEVRRNGMLWRIRSKRAPRPRAMCSTRVSATAISTTGVAVAGTTASYGSSRT